MSPPAPAGRTREIGPDGCQSPAVVFAAAVVLSAASPDAALSAAFVYAGAAAVVLPVEEEPHAARPSAMLPARSADKILFFIVFSFFGAPPGAHDLLLLPSRGSLVQFLFSLSHRLSCHRA